MEKERFVPKNDVLNVSNFAILRIYAEYHYSQ